MQRAGLTPDGLRGMRLIVYIGMLADRSEGDPGRIHQIPAELAATVDMYQTNAFDAGQWIHNKETEPLHPMIILQRENCTDTEQYGDRIYTDYESASLPVWQPATRLFTVQKAAAIKMDGGIVHSL